MMVSMTAMLVSVVELSNIFSVLAVLICFCAMVLFIMRNMMVFRLHGEDLVFGSSIHPVQKRIPQMKMMKVHIPFTFKLQETSNPTYSVECSVTSQVQYSLHVLWGASIRELHLFLWKPWSVIQQQMQQRTLLQGHYQQQGCIITKPAHLDETFTLFLPQPGLDLGTPPRLCYPLVIFLIRNDLQTVHPDETVALISVVHIKDVVCTLPTSILAQYLKQANGQLSSLKQLYMATGNAPTYEGEPAVPRSDEELCVVCQFFPLSRALLPCRHTCVCASCFGKLERCPMCRGPIRSYFCIRSEEYMPPEPREPPSKPPPVFQWLHDWNDHLTDFLGFQR